MHVDPQLGIIEFVRNERAKHIRVRVMKSGLKVTLPYRSTNDDALKFIYSIRQKLIEKQSKLADSIRQSNILIAENKVLRTLTFDVSVLRTERKNIHFAFKNKQLLIEFPCNLDCEKEEYQKHFWNGISYFMRKEAKRILPERTKQLAEKFGFTFANVKIQSSKTRWGSCSSKKTINFSLYLLLLPQHLVDYVILHELCHTKEMNHGIKFWMLMDEVTVGKSKSLRLELKKYHMPN